MINWNDVKKLRHELKLTQKELAEKLGVSIKTIANYESGGVIPANKQIMIERMLFNTHNSNITGDRNISNTGIVGGDISIVTDQEIKNFIKKIVDLEKEVIKLQGELTTRDETIKGLKNELAIRIEMINFLQNKK